MEQLLVPSAQLLRKLNTNIEESQQSKAQENQNQ
jgi:hypothetical protein